MNLAELSVVVRVARDQFRRELKTAIADSKATQTDIQKQLDKINMDKAGKSAHSFDKINFRNLLYGTFGVYALYRGIKSVGGAFIDAANTAEQYQLRLKSLLGSQAEGSRLFKEMTAYARTVPFELEDLMEGAATLAGIMEGGVDEIMRWIPLIGDLAAVTGFTMRETMGQFVRMYSAGARTADLFRERGILNMLGFKAQVYYTAEETREIMMREWTRAGSKFKGVTEDLATTWTGTLSMMADKWFIFRNLMMEGGTFDVLKAGIQSVDKAFGTMLDNMEKEVFKQKAEKWAAGKWTPEVSTAPVGPYGMMGTAPQIKWDENIYRRYQQYLQVTEGKTKGQLLVSKHLRGIEEGKRLYQTAEAEEKSKAAEAEEKRINELKAYYFNEYLGRKSEQPVGFVGPSPRYLGYPELGISGGEGLGMGKEPFHPRLTLNAGIPTPAVPTTPQPNFGYQDFTWNLENQWSRTMTNFVMEARFSTDTVQKLFEDMSRNIASSFLSAFSEKIAGNLINRLFDEDSFLGMLLENKSRGGVSGG